jgi:hypothetical protein
MQNFAADQRLSRRANTVGRPTAAPPVRSESSRPAPAPEAELAQEDTQRRGCVHLVEHPRRAAGAQHVHIVDARNLTITARKGSHGMAIWISVPSKGAPDPGWADSGALALETVARGRSRGCSRICTVSRIHGSGVSLWSGRAGLIAGEQLGQRNCPNRCHEPHHNRCGNPGCNAADGEPVN